MDKKTIAAVAIILVVLGSGYAIARPSTDGFWNGMMGGMMGGSGFGQGMMGSGMMGSGMGSGMMGGQSGMLNSCGTMMGYSGNSYGVNATPLPIEKAKESVEQYLASTGNTDLVLTEVMEFKNHFYAEVKEKT